MHEEQHPEWGPGLAGALSSLLKGGGKDRDLGVED
jgi:hypothetical protein